MSDSFVALKFILPHKTFVYNIRGNNIKQHLHKIWIIIKLWNKSSNFDDKYHLCNFLSAMCELTCRSEFGWIDEEIECNFNQEKLSFKAHEWTFCQISKMSNQKFVQRLSSI